MASNHSPIPPFRIAGNLYFVGNYAASCHLLATEEGLILIDTGYARDAASIEEHLSALGFDIRDVRFILHSHGHGDHSDATAALLEKCGAQTWVRREDIRYLKGFTPTHDYKDGEVIRLGSTEITVLHTPGHTEGTVSFFFNVTENGKVLRCGMFGGAGIPQVTNQFLNKAGLSLGLRAHFFASIERLEKEHVDLFVGNHSWQNHTTENARILAETCENRFIDDQAWGRFLAETRQKLTDMIHREIRTDFVNYAHRGASAYCPENTFLSFYTGLYMGANGIETDVRRTSDGKLVLFHDGTLERVTGAEGSAADHTFEELSALWAVNGGRRDKLVLFEDFLRHFAPLGAMLAIELKDDGTEEEIAALIEQTNCRLNVEITSFRLDRLQKMRAIAPKLRLGWLVKEPITDELLAECRENGLTQICPRADLLTPESVEKAHLLGFRVRAWGVSDENRMRLAVDAGCDGMTVNFPDKLAAYLKEKYPTEA